MYNHKEIEQKWQKYWEENKTFKVKNDFSKPKYYVLDMFPYPSGAGLHVGHPKGYTANDIISRYKNACGYNVLHPMGWDAFGLPAENYAIKTGTHPKITTEKNIKNFKKQIKSLGFSYDWDREINTTDSNYYRWTQWIFLKLFENGLAYEQDLPINYCPSCKTRVANEEILNDFTHERCGTKVEKRKIRQWVLAITKYADRLLNDIDKLDWPESIKEMQRNWIGKSEGCEFEMKVIKNETQKKGELPTPQMGGHNVQAKFSSENSIFKSMQKVKKKIIFSGKIEGKLKLNNKIILFNSENIFKHFRKKNKYEFYRRKELLATVFENLKNLYFETEFIGYFILKNTVIKVILGKQANGNYYVKSYYKHDRYTILYKEFLDNINKTNIQNLPSIKVYTTRIDTVFGMTYAVVAPDHPNVQNFITKEQEKVCNEYIQKATRKLDQDRTQENKEKTGVFTGSYVVNPFNGEKVPLWIGDYVLGNYGTGAVMAVPAHDKRDFEFAKKYNLKIIQTVVNDPKNEILQEIKEPFTQDGILVNSGNFSGLSSKKAREKLIKYAEENGFGKHKINYKLRDWLFSRQRYWGEPIPLIHLDKDDVEKLPHISSLKKAKDKNLAYVLEDSKGNKKLVIGGKIFSSIYDGLYTKIVCDYNIPVKLPKVDNYEPAGDGNSPLAKIDDFVNIKLAQNLTGKRETNTMPQWAGSCWYYLRYMDPDNENELVNPEVEKYWGQVDSYVGGAEHAVLHLLYARFWHKFLYDIGVVSHAEPFYRLRNQGLIQAFAYRKKNGGLVPNDLVEEKDGKYFEKETGEELEQVVSKMSKSLKNVINPDEIIEKYGADSLRLYEMYMADFKDSAPWDTKGIIGVRRFLEKVERLFSNEAKLSDKDDNFTMKLLHKTIKKVQEDIENYKFNTAIASMMILVNNGLPKDEKLSLEFKKSLLIILSPFAPHLAEELWERIGEKKSIFFAFWPKYDEKMVIDDTIKIAVQVMGKLRGEIEIKKDEEKSLILEKAKKQVLKYIEGKEIVKEIYVPGKIVNIVIKKDL